MTSGNQTLSSIERAILDLRSEENRLAALLQSSTGEALRERAARADNFKALAAFELDALTRQKVVDELDSVERRALQLLKQRNQRLANLATKRARATEEATGAQTAHATSAASMAAAAAAIEELTSKVQSSIKADPEWLALEQQSVQAEAVAKGAEEKTARAEKDRESKRKPYENDRLFMYLWRSGYGTSTYRAGPLRRYIDGKVGRLVGFDSARVNYYTLTEIPLRLREHANRLREESKKQIVARIAVERRALEAGGIISLENALKTAEKVLQEAKARMDRANAELSSTDEEHGGGGQQDPEYQQAVELLAERLGREDLATLYQRALATPSSVDDRVVQALQKNEQAITNLERQTQQIREAAVQIANRRAQLEQSRARFHQAGYNDPMGGFVNGALIGTVLGSILNGTGSSGMLDGILNDGFRRRPPFSGGFGGGGGFPGGGSWGGGGDGGGSFPGAPDGGGSIGGDGGFETGGGF